MEAVAKLNNVPTSPRKMRLIADLIRGRGVDLALNTLKFDSKIGSKRLEKLLLSGISNWQEKNKEEKIEDAELYIKEIYVNGGKMINDILALIAPPAGLGKMPRQFNSSVKNHHEVVAIFNEMDGRF